MEGVPALVEKAAGNAARNGLSNVTFFHGKSGRRRHPSGLGEAHGFDKVLLDPARAGAWRGAAYK